MEKNKFDQIVGFAKFFSVIRMLTEVIGITNNSNLGDLHWIG